MKKGLLLFVCIVFLLQLNAAKVFFVKFGGNGNGSSWESPMGDLQLALGAAKAGDQIWVAAGKYTPTRQNDRTASFVLVESVTMLGGFAGNETSADQRKPHLNQTILSGEIGLPNAIQDNSFTVVFAANVSKLTIVDGFIITGGAANGFGETGQLNSCGAGWFNQGASPTIKNCDFVNNYAREGAAIYNLSGKGTSNPTISNCKFINNKADLDGGAIFNNGSYGEASPQIINCRFEGNQATYGAGILNKAVDGISKSAIIRCHFVGNSSLIRGGAIYNYREGKGTCDAVLTGCRIEDNNSMVGNDVSTNLSNETFDAKNSDNGNGY